MPQIELTDRIVQTQLCAGCGACAAIAPDIVTMTRTDDGFLRPKTTRKLDRDQRRAIAEVCPGQRQHGLSEAPFTHRLWGGYHDVMTGWSTDPELRFEAASGGALSATLLWLLETRQVDAVLSVGADTRDPLANVARVSRTRGDIIDQAASRYGPSMPLAHVAQRLDEPDRYAFVGKPCDVAGLRNWAKIDPRIDQVFPIKLSFFCAGVPSLQGARDVVQRMGMNPRDVARFRFRGRGWPGHASAVDRGGASAQLSYQESWGDVLSKHVQHRCRICADGIGLAADIVFADAWATDAAGRPTFAERDGQSLLMSRTSFGASLLSNAIAEGAIAARPTDISAIAPMQPGQKRRREELLGRLAGRVLAGLPVPRYRHLSLWRNARHAGGWRTVKAALGTARRCLRWRSSYQ